MDLENSCKKRRTVAVKFITEVVTLHESGKKWLVEWSDMTRTWETYDVVKDLQVFQQFLYSSFIKAPPKVFKTIPSYIG